LQGSVSIYCPQLSQVPAQPVDCSEQHAQTAISVTNFPYSLERYIHFYLLPKHDKALKRLQESKTQHLPLLCCFTRMFNSWWYAG